MSDHQEDLVPAHQVGAELAAEYDDLNGFKYLKSLRLIADGQIPARRVGKWLYVERSHFPLVAKLFGIVANDTSKDAN